MLSLLLGALMSSIEDWLTPPDTVEWGISETGFVFIITAMILIAIAGIVGTIRTQPSSKER